MQGFFMVFSPANWILVKPNVLRGASGHSKVYTGSSLDAILIYFLHKKLHSIALILLILSRH